MKSNYNKFKDVILELCAGRYQPDRKLIFIITYINVNSNHLLDIVKALPDSISKRISNISFGKDVLSAGGCKESLDNKKKTHQREKSTPDNPNCNCQQKDTRPLKGNCLDRIYRRNLKKNINSAGIYHKRLTGDTFSGGKHNFLQVGEQIKLY